MKANLRNTLNSLVFLTIGIFFFWLAYHNIKFSEIKSILKGDVNYYWVLVCLLLGLISHIFRALRWIILLEMDEKKPSFWNTFFAVFIGYFANLAVPRMGEVSRCGVLAKYENLNFTKTLGTVLTERLVDVLSMLIICGLTLLLQIKTFRQFFSENSITLNSHPLLIVVSIIIVLLAFASIFIVFRYFGTHKWVVKIKSFLASLWEGMKSIKVIKRKKTFIIYSILIWLMYYLMNYTCMFAFNGLSGITPSQALVVFIAGTLSMLLPVPGGGMGPWHTFTIQALTLFGISQAESSAYAILAHGAPMFMIIIGGLICTLIIPIYNRNTEIYKFK